MHAILSHGIGGNLLQQQWGTNAQAEGNKGSLLASTAQGGMPSLAADPKLCPHFISSLYVKLSRFTQFERACVSCQKPL